MSGVQQLRQRTPRHRHVQSREGSRRCRTLEMLNRGASQADVAAHHKHTPRTVRTWLKKVAVQSLRIHDRYFRKLELGNVQLDELVGFIKGATTRHFIWTALDATTKIFPVWHVGGRKLQDAQIVIHQLKSRLASDYIPIFTSDPLRHHFSALCSHFGEYRREPGHRNLIWRVSSKLLYAILSIVEESSKSILASVCSIPSPCPFSAPVVRFAMPFKPLAFQEESKPAM